MGLPKVVLSQLDRWLGVLPAHKIHLDIENWENTLLFQLNTISFIVHLPGLACESPQKKTWSFWTSKPKIFRHTQQCSRPPVLSLAYLGLYEGGRPWCCGITNNKSKLGIVYHWHIGFATLLSKNLMNKFMISVFHQVLFWATFCSSSR